MGLLSGTVAVTRFNVVVPPEGPDFERARFWEIEPGSEVRERMGFVPFELDAPYEAALGRYVFRVRVDRIRPDATAVKERRDRAESELALRQAPRTKIIEAVIDGSVLYVASTAKTWLGTVLTLLRQAGVEGDFKAPWLDSAPETDERSDVVIPKEPGESVLGCRYLRALLDESDVMVEPETGSVRLATREARVTLAGAVLHDLVRYLEEGAEILSAKIHVGPVLMRFDALSYRLNGLKLEPVKNEHWTIDLDQRLEQIAAIFETLDTKYVALQDKINAVGGPPAPALVPEDSGERPPDAGAAPWEEE